MSVKDLRRLLRNMLNTPPKLSIREEWDRVVKATVARFVRGNIAAQNRRIRTAGAQAREHKKAVAIARKWRDRANHAA